ncbi:hypothetical protein GH866_28375 [Bacillus thuringiensis]|nr:hypothetical protein [Bacillus thuringiensis]
MVTGKIDIKGKTYYFKPGTGEMMTGWVYAMNGIATIERNIVNFLLMNF